MFDTPGVYLRETTVGVRPIAAVSTSNTAFVGVFQRGPVNKATRVTSLGEFERLFGGAWSRSDAAHSVRSYFMNGGAVAYIVRADTSKDTTKKLQAASKTFKTEGATDTAMTVKAASEGSWGDQVYVGVAVDPTGVTLLVREYSGTSVVREEVFDRLQLKEGESGYIETAVNGISEIVTLEHASEKKPEATKVTATVTAKTLADLAGLDKAKLTKLEGGGDGITPLDDKGAVDQAWEAAAKGALVGSAANQTGLYALNAIVPETFNLLCLPDAAAMKAASVEKAKLVYEPALTFCREAYAFLLVDTPRALKRDKVVSDWVAKLGAVRGPDAACYFPRLSGADPVNPLKTRSLPTSGAMAGLMARTDAGDGVWRAAAGTDAVIAGGAPEEVITERQHGPINLAGVNVIRTLPIYGNVVMGARTLDGVAGRASASTYVSVRRLTLFIEASLKRGLMWVPFEPNDENTWSSIRLSANAFMSDLHQRGAFQGALARGAYLVRCGADTTNQNDINRGIVNIVVGFQPVQPIEFVVVNIQIGMQRA